MINVMLILLSIIILIIGGVMTHLNSQLNVSLNDQNNSVYIMSIIVVSIGVLLMVGIIGMAVAYPISMRLYSNIMIMLLLTGIIITAVGSIAVDTYNNSSISTENKSDIYIKVSTTLTAVGSFAVCFFALYWWNSRSSILQPQGIESLF
jgi:hypothetical protein